MATPQPRRASDFEVSDPAAAFDKLQEFTKRVLAVPKKEIDKRLRKPAKGKRRANTPPA